MNQVIQGVSTGASSSDTCSLCSAGTYSSSPGMHHIKQSNTYKLFDRARYLRADSACIQEHSLEDRFCFNLLIQRVYTGGSSSATCSLCSAGTYSSSSGIHHTKQSCAVQFQQIRESRIVRFMHMQSEPAHTTISKNIFQMTAPV